MQKYEELIERLRRRSETLEALASVDGTTKRYVDAWKVESASSMGKAATDATEAAEALTALCGELEEEKRKKTVIETDDGVIIIRVLGTSITICAETAGVFNAELGFPAKTVLLGTDLSDIVEEYSDAILAKHKEKNDG